MSVKDLGLTLRETREKRGASLGDAAKATRIRSYYLKALEEGEFGLLPSPAQVRGFLRTYANFLELDPDQLAALLQPPPSPPFAQEQLNAEQQVHTPVETMERPAGFTQVAQQLRERRESLELTLLEVEANTHIPEHYLARLENGEFDSFPSPTQARGMLANYAEFLGLEAGALLNIYAETLQMRLEQRRAAAPTPRRFALPELPKVKFRLPDWAKSMANRDTLVGGSAGFLLIAFVLFSIGRIAATRAAQEPEPTAPPLLGLLIQTEPSISPEELTPSPPSEDSFNILQQETANPALLGQSTIQAGSGPISVRFLATQRTWMRVTVDGRVEFEGRTMPGQNYSFSASINILLLTGNGAALRIFFNEQNLGIAGIYGEVVEVVFNSQGAATPTLSPTPTVDPGILTATAEAFLTPSATPSPTITPSPTRTPTDEPDGTTP
ncbi:MAG: RodZ domain-containing protein [Anaerolineales bacterium]